MLAKKENVMSNGWIEGWRDKFVGFVVETRKGKFKPIIGVCLVQPDDDDCLVYTHASKEPMDTIEEALSHLDLEKDKLFRIFRMPQRSGGIMGQWLRPMVLSEGEEPWLN